MPGPGKKFGKDNPPTGRPKGAKNKKTMVLENFCEVIIEDGMDRFKEELSKLKGRDYVNGFATLLEYVKPKFSRVDVTTANKPLNNVPLFDLSKLTDEQLRILAKLQRESGTGSTEST